MRGDADCRLRVDTDGCWFGNSRLAGEGGGGDVDPDMEGKLNLDGLCLIESVS